MVIRRIGVGSAAKVAAAIYATIGLIVGVVIFLLSLMGAGLAGAVEGQGASPAWLAPVFGVGAVVVLPILYGVCGALGSAIFAAVYNFAAGMAGGIQLEVDQ